MENINTEVCDVCLGTGFWPERMLVENLSNFKYDLAGKKMLRPGERERSVYDYILCRHCKGRGKVDWVSKVTGSRSTEIPKLEELTKEVCNLINEGKIFIVLHYPKIIL